MLLQLHFLSLILVPFVGVNAQDCYANLTDPYSLFATKTGYFKVDNEETDEIKFPGCEAKSLWLLARHGTRNPGDDDILEMAARLPQIKKLIIDNYNQGKVDLCDIDVEGIRNWTFNLTVEVESELTESGKLEHHELGQRFKKRLPTLLGGKYLPEDFQVRHTYKKRTADSAIAFVSSVFPNEDVVITPPLDEDKVLRFFDFCPAWTSSVDENPDTLQEQKLFQESKYFEDLVIKVNSKIGSFKRSPAPKSDNWQALLDIKDVIVMYEMCRFEKAWYPDNVSVWCAIFDEADLKILEYNEDLEYWYTNGYYNPLNYEMACPLLSDLVQNFDGFVDGIQSDPLNGTLYFSHSEAVLPFLAMLGMYNDGTVPRHDNYEDMSSRAYYTSRIGSFTNNFAAILFDCGGSPKVVALHQETPVKLENCNDVLCDWELFKHIYQVDIQCLFDSMCQLRRI